MTGHLVAGEGNYAGADPEDPDEVESEASFEETMGALTAELAIQMKEAEELDKEIKI
jgi:hypothetical protein